MRPRALLIGTAFAIASSLALSSLAPSSLALAQGRSARVERIDRVVVRWHARATGGVTRPQFITARELAFEARLEALAEGYRTEEQPYNEEHVRAAIQRHITEAILAELPATPPATPKQVGNYAEAARLLIEKRVGGRQVLNDAASTEGLDSSDLNALLRQRARASWYLDRMVAPMLKPSDLDLREVHSRGETPYSRQAFESVKESLRNWYISTRLAKAIDRYYRNIRARVNVTLIQYDSW